MITPLLSLKGDGILATELNKNEQNRTGYVPERSGQLHWQYVTCFYFSMGNRFNKRLKTFSTQQNKEGFQSRILHYWPILQNTWEIDKQLIKN